MTQFSRRTVLNVIGGSIVGQTTGWGHDLRPGDPTYRFREYEDIVNRAVRVKQVYQWPNIANQIIFGNVRNGLNGFQFSYDVPADNIQIVVQAYASANAANLRRLHLGEVPLGRSAQRTRPKHE